MSWLRFVLNLKYQFVLSSLKCERLPVVLTRQVPITLPIILPQVILTSTHINEPTSTKSPRTHAPTSPCAHKPTHLRAHETTITNMAPNSPDEGENSRYHTPRPGAVRTRRPSCSIERGRDPYGDIDTEPARRSRSVPAYPDRARQALDWDTLRHIVTSLAPNNTAENQTSSGSRRPRRRRNRRWAKRRWAKRMKAESQNQAVDESDDEPYVRGDSGKEDLEGEHKEQDQQRPFGVNYDGLWRNALSADRDRMRACFWYGGRSAHIEPSFRVDSVWTIT